MSSSSAAATSPVDTLRTLLHTAGVEPPDNALLQALLTVEGGDPQRAARVIIDDASAHSGSTGAPSGGYPTTESTATAAQPLRAVDVASVRGNGTTRVQRLDVDRTLAHRALRGAGSGAPSSRPGGAGLNGGARGSGDSVSIPSVVFSVLSFPFQLAGSLLSFLVRILGLRALLPLLGFGTTSPSRPGAGGRRRNAPPSGTLIDPRSAAERWVLALHDDVGAVPSSTSDEDAAGRPRVPNFVPIPYTEALTFAKDTEQARILVVVLTSQEHGDDEEFKKNTLTHPPLVEALSDPEFVVWAGDVREREAWDVANLLEATTYPFVAFVALRPPRSIVGPRGMQPTSETPKLAILSRLEGNPSSTLSGPALHTHITDFLLPRVRPYLNQTRSRALARARDRAMRAEQDAAYERASRADAERVLRVRQEEKKRIEAEQMLERKRAERRKAREEEESARVQWVRWARAHLVPPEPDTTIDTPVARLAFTLPDGSKLTRTFRADAPLAQIFAFVECAATSDQSASTSVAADNPSPAFQHAFTILLRFPRQVLEPGSLASKRINDIDGLCPAASLVVEGRVGDVGPSGSRRRSSAAAGAVLTGTSWRRSQEMQGEEALHSSSGSEDSDDEDENE